MIPAPLLPMAVGAHHRVAQHDQYPNVRQEPSRAFRGARVMQVVRRGFSDHDGLAHSALLPVPREGRRQMRPVPAFAARVVQVEVVNPFGGSRLRQMVGAREERAHLRVLEQVVVEGRAAAPLRTDDQEGRIGAPPGRRDAVTADRGAARVHDQAPAAILDRSAGLRGLGRAARDHAGAMDVPIT